MSKRLNDTAAVQAMPALRGDYEGERYSSHTKSTRKIDNGYVTRECHGDGDSFRTTERFHETPEPAAEGQSSSLVGDGHNTMSRAKSYLNK